MFKGAGMFDEEVGELLECLIEWLENVRGLLGLVEFLGTGVEMVD
jgi:hypothetical protein